MSDAGFLQRLKERKVAEWTLGVSGLFQEFRIGAHQIVQGGQPVAPVLQRAADGADAGGQADAGPDPGKYRGDPPDA